MKHLITLMSMCLCLFSACDYFLPDDTSTDQGIMLTNESGLSGTYIVTGPHSFWDKTTKWLSFPPQGEYKVFFTNLPVDGNICSVVDNTPVFIGEASFDIAPPYNRQSISVPIREITCRLSFKQESGTRISKILVSGIPSTIYIDGEFGKPTSLQLSGDCYVIASLMEVSVCTINGSEEAQDMNVLKTRINAEPGYRYTINVGRENISVSSN